MKFTIGADPELFLRNSNGKMISAVGLIGGTKLSPKPISEVGHAIQEDNVSVEFNIPPSQSATDFVNHLNFVLDHLKVRAGELGLEFAEKVASHSFDFDQLCTPEAQTFGCEPDYNAWTRKMNPKPMSDDKNLRSCGGHVHVGTKLDPIKIIRAMDLFLGVPAVEIDPDTKRRELYGKAGAFRPKPYGAEYRTLSNFWIWDEGLKDWVFRQTEKAVEFVESGKEMTDYHGILVRRAINKGDHAAVKSLNKVYGVCQV